MKTFWVFMTLEVEAEDEWLAEYVARDVMLHYNKAGGKQVVWTVDSVYETEKPEEVE